MNGCHRVDTQTEMAAARCDRLYRYMKKYYNETQGALFYPAEKHTARE